MNNNLDFNFDKPIDRKKAFYRMLAKAKDRDIVAKARFDRPPYYMQFLSSWTTGKEKDNE